MAATYSFRAPAVTQAINKTMFVLYNDTASGKVLRLYRMWLLSMSSAAVTGGMGTYVLDRITGAPGAGTTITPIKHNTTSAAIPAQITARHGNVAITGTFTSGGILRRFSRSNDEVAVTSLTIDEFQQLHAFNAIWDGGFGDSNVEPIVLREGQGIRLYSLNAGTFGASTVDIIGEFTLT